MPRRTERGVNLEQYDANLRRIYTVYTVQRFWAVYYNIPKPADLQVRSRWVSNIYLTRNSFFMSFLDNIGFFNCSLHMMRDDRKPVWEEEYNCKGGTFRLRVHKKDSVCFKQCIYYQVMNERQQILFFECKILEQGLERIADGSSW